MLLRLNGTIATHPSRHLFTRSRVFSISMQRIAAFISRVSLSFSAILTDFLCRVQLSMIGPQSAAFDEPVTDCCFLLFPRTVSFNTIFRISIVRFHLHLPASASKTLSCFNPSILTFKPILFLVVAEPRIFHMGHKNWL